MSTRNEPRTRALGGLWPRTGRPPDPVEEVAQLASAKRELLLRAHRFRLRREDLEDCYSQATLEMVLRARRGNAFASRRHIFNALEQRFLSRVQDRRRALAGRTALALVRPDPGMGALVGPPPAGSVSATAPQCAG